MRGPFPLPVYFESVNADYDLTLEEMANTEQWSLFVNIDLEVGGRNFTKSNCKVQCTERGINLLQIEDKL